MDSSTNYRSNNSNYIPPENDIEQDALLSDQDSTTPLYSTNVRRRRDANPICLALLVVFPAFFGIIYYYINNDTPKHTAIKYQKIPSAAHTILISIDGFRNEYLSRKGSNSTYLAPNLRKLAHDGVYATKGMQPVMPSITFPNHWSIVTGLYPQNHGIIGNTMYDPIREKWFHHTRNDSAWYHGEPIWQTLSKTNQILKDPKGKIVLANQTYTTAAILWPGSDVDQLQPDAYWNYDGSISYKKRIQRCISLLTGKAHDIGREVDFVALYFEHVDQMGHHYGPKSKQVDDAIIEVDNAIAYLLKHLKHLQPNHLNLIIVSDHGMTDISSTKSIDLKNAIPQGTAQDIRLSPMGLFLNVSTSAKQLYSQISKGLKGHENHAKVYLKQNLPERWHLKQSPLIPPVVTMASLGWTMTYPHQHLVPGSKDPLMEHGLNTGVGKGEHGFDNTEEDMQAIFIVNGPAFQKNVQIESFRIVDLYPMICHMFAARPAPNNGSVAGSVPYVLR